MTRVHVVSKDGDRCPRCHRPMAVYEHKTVGEKQLRQPFYYSRWFRCEYGDCKTTLVMSERYKVFPAIPEVSRGLEIGGDIVMDVLAESNWLSDAEHAAQVGPPPWQED